MKLLKSLAVAVIALSSTMSAFAQDLVTITGFDNLSSADCPILRDPKIVNNKLDFALNLDFLLFPGETYKTARCMFNTQVKVKSGYKMKIKRIAFGGNFDQEGDARGRVTGSYRVLGDASPVSSTGWMSKGQSFEQKSPIDSNTPWSACGATVDIEARSDAALLSTTGTGLANMIIQNAVGGFMTVEYDCIPCS